MPAIFRHIHRIIKSGFGISLSRKDYLMRYSLLFLSQIHFWNKGKMKEGSNPFGSGKGKNFLFKYNKKSWVLGFHSVRGCIKLPVYFFAGIQLPAYYCLQPGKWLISGRKMSWYIFKEIFSSTAGNRNGQFITQNSHPPSPFIISNGVLQVYKQELCNPEKRRFVQQFFISFSVLDIQDGFSVDKPDIGIIATAFAD